KQGLITLDYVFWYATIICQVVACGALIWRREFFKHWKVFSYYVFYMAGAMILRSPWNGLAARTPLKSPIPWLTSLRQSC
ncbi:MAG TPA: hypothetical protein VNB54_01420, partial [Alphaproteobacteria bacterium]|nr:hypothetical protein [Alphaproteobacteria bacterium]